MIKFKHILLLTGLMTSLSISANERSGVYERHEEGYFWYKDEPDPASKKIMPVLPPPAAQPAPTQEKKDAEPPAFSSAWLRVNLEKLRDVAMDDPSPDNIRNYLYAQRVMFDKSEAFADLSAEAARFDPLLDENNRVPISNNASNWAGGQAVKARIAILKHLSDKGGLWFFFDSKCVHCVYQYDTVKNFAAKYKYTLWNISKDGKGLSGMDQFIRDRGQFDRLGLSMTPSVIFVVPPDNMYAVAQGAMSIAELEDRILTVASKKGMIPEDLRKQWAIFEKGRLMPDDFKDAKDLDLSTPDSWVKYVQEKLKRRY